MNPIVNGVIIMYLIVVTYHTQQLHNTVNGPIKFIILQFIVLFVKFITHSQVVSISYLDHFLV